MRNPIGALKMKKFIIVGALALSMTLAISAQAFEVTNRIGSSVSSTLSLTSYSVSGTIKKTTDSQRDVLHYTDGILTTGDIVKHEVTETHVDQGGSGVGMSGSATLYASLKHGGIEVGGSASVGSETMSSVAWNNSAIHQTGTTRTDVDMYDLSGWFPNHVGSETEVTYENTWVNLANVDYTQMSGSWSAQTVYIK